MNQLNPDSLEQVAPASELQGQTKNGSLENRTLAREWLEKWRNRSFQFCRTVLIGAATPLSGSLLVHSVEGSDEEPKRKLCVGENARVVVCKLVRCSE